MEVIAFLLPFVLLGAIVMFVALLGRARRRPRGLSHPRQPRLQDHLPGRSTSCSGVVVPALILAAREEAAGGTGALTNAKPVRGGGARQDALPAAVRELPHPRRRERPRRDRAEPRPDRRGHPAADRERHQATAGPARSGCPPMLLEGEEADGTWPNTCREGRRAIPAAAAIVSDPRRTAAVLGFAPSIQPKLRRGAWGNQRGREARGESPQVRRSAALSARARQLTPQASRKRGPMQDDGCPQTCGRMTTRELASGAPPESWSRRRSPTAPAGHAPVYAENGRRTVKITGHPVPPRRRPSPAQTQIQARPTGSPCGPSCSACSSSSWRSPRPTPRRSRARSQPSAGRRPPPLPGAACARRDAPRSDARWIRSRQPCVLAGKAVTGVPPSPILTLRKSLTESEAADEDQGEQVPSPRRADGAGAQPSGAQGRACGRRAAVQHHRRARRVAGHAPRATRASAPSFATARCRSRPSSGSRWRWPSTRAASTRWPSCSAPPVTPDSGSTRSRWRGSSTPATSARPRSCATSRRCSRATARRRCISTRRRARPAGTTSRSWRRSLTWRCDTFANLVTRAGEVPEDGSAEEARLLQAA